MFCTDQFSIDIYNTLILGLFSPYVPVMVYYSHFTAIIISMALGILVFLKNAKSAVAGLLFSITVLFSILSLLDVFLWTQAYSSIIMFLWSFWLPIFISVFILCFYFLYNFIYNRNPHIIVSIFSLTSLIVITALSLTRINLVSFSVDECIAIENIPFVSIVFLYSFLILLATLVLGLFNTIKNNLPERRREVFLATIGISAFLFLFSSTAYISSIAEYIPAIQPNFSFEQYGYFGMTIFIAFLAYLIVKFKAFNIKLIGAQALVWALIIITGSEFFFVKSTVNQVLVGVSLVLSAIVGLIIVRSVKKEIAQREELAVVSENQQLLIRFITHQVKGFFTKSKIVFASILEGDMGDVSTEIKDIVKIGLESDNSAVNMVQEVLTAASLKTGQMTYNLENTDINKFVSGIAESFREAAVAKGLTYEVNLPEKEITVNIDKLQIIQVLKNTIDNSVKYTPTGSIHIAVALKTAGKKMKKSVLISIKDTGVGLSDSDKAKLFKEGGRGEASLKVNVNSTGYGLFIVKKIVEGHNGNIWAESAGRGKGTTFFVELPVATI